MALPENFSIAPGDRYTIVELTTAQQYTHAQFLGESGTLVKVDFDHIGQVATMRMDFNGGLIEVRPRQLDEEES
jgi:hypothetical protein